MLYVSDMRFENHSSSNDHDLRGYDPHSEGLGRDLWQRQGDDEYYHYLHRQELTYLHLANNAPQVVEIDHITSNWTELDAEHSRPTIAGMLSGGVMLALLGYLYWML